ITGIRPKPAGLSQDLRTTQGLTMDLPTQMSLQSKGYFVSQDGRLLSNEGEVAFGTSEGVLYTLRFGEILLGEGFNISAGFETEGEEGTASENEISAIENRYLFVTAQFDESLLPTKPDAPEGYTPADANPAPDENIPPRNPSFTQYEQDLETWQQNLDQSIARATELNARFAPWYYVISSSEFEAIRPGKDKLLKDKPAPPVELEPEPLETPVDPVPTPDGSPDTDEGSTTPDG
ncbi:MAG: hypothetical protein O7G85_14380, partial [Planctomycetota bacterium]|nr:hypothetical protein [Planctomycetota bacterium]